MKSISLKIIDHFKYFLAKKKSNKKSKIPINCSLACRFCNEPCKNRIELTQHIQITHEMYTCNAPKCEKLYKNIEELNDHRINDHQIPTCPICKTLSDTKDLNVHLRNKHRDVESIVCDECGEHFDDKYIFVRHHRHLHGIFEQCICDYCGAV